MKTKLTAILFAIIFLCSCTSAEKVTYMLDAETIPQEVLKNSTTVTNPIVMPGDLIDIIVSGVNMDALKPFNRMDYLYQIGGNSLVNNMSNTTNPPSYYLVNNDGDIDFPVLGKIHIGGMNKAQVEEFLLSELYPKYLKEKPTIDIRFKNFKVSVIGEVKNPGVYTSSNERLTILEAIALAGDLNITGERKNVMLIRTNSDGSKVIQRLNLNDKNLIISPYYDLHQNDVIYVQPNASKARSSWTIPPAVTLILSSVGTLISITTLIVTLTKE